MHAMLLWATAGVWIAFIAYWSIAAGNSAALAAPPTGKRRWISIQFKVAQKSQTPAAAPQSKAARESAASRQTHQLLLWAALLLALLPGFFPFNQPVLPQLRSLDLIGLGVQVLFALLYIWAKVSLGRFWSGRIQTSADHELIRTGPYRWLRHPMYTAIIGMFLGTALVWNEWHALLGAVIGIVAYWRKMRLEEEHLRQHLGLAYDHYRRGSWALIPGIY